MGVVRTVVVDRQTYEVEASEGSARARYGDLELSLPRWSGADHLRALGRHLVPGLAGLELDAEGYAAELLARIDAPVERWPELVPLALWWATRPELDGERLDDGGLALAGGARAQLADCAWRQRIDAARHGLVRSDEGAAVDPVRVLEQLCDRVLDGVEDADGRSIAPQELDGPSFVHLCAHVVEHSSRESPFPELEAFEDAPEPARELLELCRVLGRTPTQVLELPAREVDLVRGLVALAGGTGAPQAPKPSRVHAPLHDAPDAVVIDFGDGGAA